MKIGIKRKAQKESVMEIVPTNSFSWELLLMANRKEIAGKISRARIKAPNAIFTRNY
jgi:hypothetical protein